MNYQNWDADKNYDHLDNKGEFSHAAGVIPTGTQVKFHADGDIGTVVHSNSEKSLISHAGSQPGTTERNWYKNSEVQVPT